MARLSTEQKEALIEDIKAGNGTGAEIAEKHGVSVATVATTKRKLGLTRGGTAAPASTGAALTVDEQIAAGRKLQNILNANGLDVQFTPSFDDNFKVKFSWSGLEGYEINEGAAPSKITKDGAEVPIFIQRGQEAQVTLKLSDFAKLLK